MTFGTSPLGVYVSWGNENFVIGRSELTRLSEWLKQASENKIGADKFLEACANSLKHYLAGDFFWEVGHMVHTDENSTSAYDAENNRIHVEYYDDWFTVAEGWVSIETGSVERLR